MSRLEDSIRVLPKRHQDALYWFVSNSGLETKWPNPLSDGTFLVSRAKGIYKPHWTKYALSVRESLGKQYPDEEPIIRTDGTWLYRYFQENKDVKQRDLEYTNRGLFECIQDKVPVGVIIQIKAKPDPMYLVQGVALVSGWEDGYFILEGSISH